MKTEAHFGVKVRQRRVRLLWERYRPNEEVPPGEGDRFSENEHRRAFYKVQRFAQGPSGRSLATMMSPLLLKVTMRKSLMPRIGSSGPIPCLSHGESGSNTYHTGYKKGDEDGEEGMRTKKEEGMRTKKEWMTTKKERTREKSKGARMRKGAGAEGDMYDYKVVTRSYDSDESSD